MFTLHIQSSVFTTGHFRYTVPVKVFSPVIVWFVHNVTNCEFNPLTYHLVTYVPLPPAVITAFILGLPASILQFSLNCVYAVAIGAIAQPVNGCIINLALLSFESIFHHISPVEFARYICVFCPGSHIKNCSHFVSITLNNPTPGRYAVGVRTGRSASIGSHICTPVNTSRLKDPLHLSILSALNITTLPPEFICITLSHVGVPLEVNSIPV